MDTKGVVVVVVFIILVAAAFWYFGTRPMSVTSTPAPPAATAPAVPPAHP
jgi:hypothetical protein